MPSNSLIQPLFCYRRILLHPVYINRVHIRNKREYEGDNYSYSTTFLQKIWSEGALKGLTLLLFPHPLMSYRVLFDCIHIICKERGHGAGRGGSLSAVVSAVLSLSVVLVVSVCLVSFFLYVSHETLLYIMG